MARPFNLAARMAALNRAINCREIRANWPCPSIVESSDVHDTLIFYDSLTKRQHEKSKSLSKSSTAFEDTEEGRRSNRRRRGSSIVGEA